MTYSKADRERASALYIDEGATAAARSVGASRQSVYVWLAESDTDPKKEETFRAATAERLATKRAAMVELFHDKALELAAAVDPDDPATARFMLAACQAADKALLLAGLGTATPPVLTVGWLNSEIARLEAERDRREPGWRDARHDDLDREMEKMWGEYERKVRAELLAEVDAALTVDQDNGDVPPWQIRRAEIIREVASRPANRDKPGRPNGDDPVLGNAPSVVSSL